MLSSGLRFRLLFPHSGCGAKDLFDSRYLPRHIEEQDSKEKQEQVSKEEQVSKKEEKQEQVSKEKEERKVWWQLAREPHEALFWTMFRAKYGADRYHAVMRLTPTMRSKTMQDEKQRLVAQLSKPDVLLDEEDKVQLSVLCMPTHRDKALPTLVLYARAYSMSMVVKSNTKPIRYRVENPTPQQPSSRHVVVWINDRGDIGLQEEEDEGKDEGKEDEGKDEDEKEEKEERRFVIEHPLRPLLPCARYPVATLRAMHHAVFHAPVEKACKKQDVYDRLCEYLALTI